MRKLVTEVQTLRLAHASSGRPPSSANGVGSEPLVTTTTSHHHLTTTESHQHRHQHQQGARGQDSHLSTMKQELSRSLHDMETVVRRASSASILTAPTAPSPPVGMMPPPPPHGNAAYGHQTVGLDVADAEHAGGLVHPSPMRMPPR